MPFKITDITFFFISRSGKTSLITKILANIQNFSKQPPKITIYVYATWQDKYDELKNMVQYFIEDDTDLALKIEQITSQTKSTLIILDDMMNSANLRYFMELFTVQARHNNMSIIFLSQTMFGGQDEALRKITNNCDYMIVHRNTRNAQQVNNLASQMTPGNKKLVDIYAAATDDEAYSYLFIDLTQQCPKHLKYRSHLFDKDHSIRVYVQN